MPAALLLCTLVASVRGVCKTGALTEQEQAVLDQHNKHRAKHVDTDPLCYGVSGNDVTFTSQTWTETIAGQGTMKHSTGSYGENLATAGRTPAEALTQTPAYIQSTDMWYEEIQYWDYATNAKSTTAPSNEPTGHFTQVVWRASKQVNCGYATYKNAYNNYMVTCQYFPPGNYNNQYAANVGPLKSTDKKTCNKPNVANAALNPNTATIEEGQKYTVTCADNYILDGSVNAFICGSDGNLTPASISCKEVQKKTCNKPNVENATLNPNTATVKEGEKYTVTCAAGHKLQGKENTFTCGTDGSLTPASITCDKDSGAGKVVLSAVLAAVVAAFLLLILKSKMSYPI